MKKGLVSEFYLTLSTLVTRRNQADMTVSTPLGERDSFSNQTMSLAKNNEAGNNPDSQLIISDVKTFFYVYATGPLHVTLINADSSVDLIIDRFFITTAGFDSVVIYNKNTSLEVDIKVVHS